MENRCSHLGANDADVYQLHLMQLVEAAVGLAAAAHVSTQVHAVNGGSVCRVHVEPSGHPVNARLGSSSGVQEKFFVRINNATRSIDDERERERYIASRWPRA